MEVARRIMRWIIGQRRVEEREQQLQRLRREAIGIAHAGPWRRRPGRHKAMGRHRWFGVGNAEEGLHRPCRVAAQPAASGLDDPSHSMIHQMLQAATTATA